LRNIATEQEWFASSR